MGNSNTRNHGEVSPAYCCSFLITWSKLTWLEIDRNLRRQSKIRTDKNERAGGEGGEGDEEVTQSGDRGRTKWIWAAPFIDDGRNPKP